MADHEDRGNRGHNNTKKKTRPPQGDPQADDKFLKRLAFRIGTNLVSRAGEHAGKIPGADKIAKTIIDTMGIAQATLGIDMIAAALQNRGLIKDALSAFSADPSYAPYVSEIIDETFDGLEHWLRKESVDGKTVYKIDEVMFNEHMDRVQAKQLIIPVKEATSLDAFLQLDPINQASWTQIALRIRKDPVKREIFDGYRSQIKRRDVYEAILHYCCSPERDTIQKRADALMEYCDVHLQLKKPAIATKAAKFADDVLKGAKDGFKKNFAVLPEAERDAKHEERMAAIRARRDAIRNS